MVEPERGRIIYGPTYQLVSENRTAPGLVGYNITYSYDPVGNRPVKNAAGSLTNSTLDAANLSLALLSATGTTTYIFDPAGNQQIEQAPTGTTTNTWDYENLTCP